MIRKLIYSTFAALLLIGTAIAQDVSVRSDHPDEYVVVKGDTLWDISGRFLDKPWQWPAIWHANPQIENPHLIYPGDRLRLKWANGQPYLAHSRGSRAGSAIPTMDYRSLKKFLSRPHLVDEASLKISGEPSNMRYSS